MCVFWSLWLAYLSIFLALLLYSYPCPVNSFLLSRTHSVFNFPSSIEIPFFPHSCTSHLLLVPCPWLHLSPPVLLFFSLFILLLILYSSRLSTSPTPLRLPLLALTSPGASRKGNTNTPDASLRSRHCYIEFLVLSECSRGINSLKIQRGFSSSSMYTESQGRILSMDSLEAAVHGCETKAKTWKGKWKWDSAKVKV